jgi:hypothetical protein
MNCVRCLIRLIFEIAKSFVGCVGLSEARSKKRCFAILSVLGFPQIKQHPKASAENWRGYSQILIPLCKLKGLNKFLLKKNRTDYQPYYAAARVTI